MKMVLAAVLAAGLGLAAAHPAQAATSTAPVTAQDGLLTLVEGGCGPGGHRGPGGYCRPNGPPPPPFRRACPPYTHMTPYGCRRN